MSDAAVTPERPAGCPVADYFDVNVAIAEPGWHFDNFDRLREQAPVFVGDAGGHDYLLLTRMADIRAAYRDTATFSNSAVTVMDPNPAYRWIPEMLDGHEHRTWRQLLTPLWSPTAVAAMVPKLRQRFAEVLDEIAERGSCEFVTEVALLFPNVIFMDLMGLPREDADQFQAWEVAILHGDRTADDSGQRRFDAMMAVVGYFSELIAERRATPRDDMLSFVVAQQIDGAPIPDQDLLDFCLLMFMAGLDTVAAQLTYNFWHLATHDDDRRRLVADPSLWPNAIEELLRYYAFVTPSRKATQDTVIAGCPIKAGQMVHLPLAPANRDPREFADAHRVVIDRAANRHIAFGAGPHRCLGAHLAREELMTAMTMWHARIPDYRLEPGFEVREHGGQVGIESLRLEWDV